MKRVKVFTVNGGVVNRPGVGRVSTLSEQIEESINKEVGKTKDDLANILVQTEGLNSLAGRDSALVILTFEGEGKYNKKGGE